jgi:hypothetical protein
LSAQPKRTAKLHTAPNKKDISNMDLANAISKIQPIQKLYLKETGAAAVSKEAAQRGVRSFPSPAARSNSHRAATQSPRENKVRRARAAEERKRRRSSTRAPASTTRTAQTTTSTSPSRSGGPSSTRCRPAHNPHRSTAEQQQAGVARLRQIPCLATERAGR